MGECAQLRLCSGTAQPAQVPMYPIACMKLSLCAFLISRFLLASKRPASRWDTPSPSKELIGRGSPLPPAPAMTGVDNDSGEEDMLPLAFGRGRGKRRKKNKGRKEKNKWVFPPHMSPHNVMSRHIVFQWVCISWTSCGLICTDTQQRTKIMSIPNDCSKSCELETCRCTHILLM